MMFSASSVGAADPASTRTVTESRQSARLVAHDTKLCALVIAVGNAGLRPGVTVHNGMPGVTAWSPAPVP